MPFTPILRFPIGENYPISIIKFGQTVTAVFSPILFYRPFVEWFRNKQKHSSRTLRWGVEPHYSRYSPVALPIMLSQVLLQKYLVEYYTYLHHSQTVCKDCAGEFLQPNTSYHSFSNNLYQVIRKGTASLPPLIDIIFLKSFYTSSGLPRVPPGSQRLL